MFQFNKKEWRIFRHLQRKHKVSMEFLQYNLVNIQKIVWYETSPRSIIKRYAIRKRNRIFLAHYRLRRVRFDQTNRKIIKRMRQNVRLWSKRVVGYRRRTQAPEEYIEETVCEDKPTNSADDVSKQLKEQLELLKSGRRHQPLINAKNLKEHEDNGEGIKNADQQSASKLKNNGDRTPAIKATSKEQETISEVETFNNQKEWQSRLESTPEKQVNIVQENARPVKQLATDEKTEKSQHEDEATALCKSTEKPIKAGVNFLDMLMSKVTSVQTVTMATEAKSVKSSLDDSFNQHEHSLDSADGFLGFDDTERLPGMLLTPLVPNSSMNNKNSIFVSETLNEYMRQNDLETNYNIDNDKSIRRNQIMPTDLEGLMTPKTQPPPLDMPAVPDNLQRFRTVAERRSYLQKFSKNSRLSIINNEASIYRELQKRIRFQKCKPSSQQVSAQSPNSAMSFTRNGWFAASFINTEYNKYYYQMLDVDNGKYKIKLKGVRGNNDVFRKKPYISKVKNVQGECPPLCVDEDMWHDFKPIKTISPRAKKLNKGPLPSVFKPCPLSHKVLQKPLDDDAAALLLAGGSMAVVRMPTVELEVFPENGKPLNEIAKRYLQYILPHHDISREWAEFSVSTLKTPGALNDALKAASDNLSRKSYTFVIPYLNDRNHVLVRRVVDRSEKLDESFEHTLDSELVPKADFTFRQNLDKTDDILMSCADVVSDMINSVAISCSENSFIKIDPDIQNSETVENALKSPSPIKNEKVSRPPSAASNSETKKQSKQRRVLSELKRLNATIIDAAVKTEKDKKPCSKEFCTMGCICDSLTEESHVREHCGKSKCMWECTCKSSNQTRIMRLETDGRTITTEDAFILRRKATARLARMEKEFTSTVVLTENETLLINETNNDKKRRCTKVPKRYECYDDDTDEEARKPSPVKTALTTIDNEKHLAVNVKEFREPVYIQDTILEKLKHSTVNLVRLENMDNVAPWCMIHNLYKCFCKGKSLEGKPMIIEKDENNSTIEHGEDELPMEMDYKINTKARYTFEKVEKKRVNEANESDDDIHAKYEPTPPPRRHKDRNRRQSSEVDRKLLRSEVVANDEMSADDNIVREEEEQPSLLEEVQDNKEKDKPKRSIEDVRERFYASRPDCCRRQIPIPRRMFLYCNRKRRPKILKYVREAETEKTRLLLNEHVMRSVYYHKADNEKVRKQQEKNATEGKAEEKQNQESTLKSHSSISNENKKQITDTTSNKNKTNGIPGEHKIHAIVDLLDDEDDENNVVNKLTQNSETPLPVVNAEANKNDTSHDSVFTMQPFGTLSNVNIGQTNLNNNSSMDNVTTTNAESQELVLPKISNCFSLNAKANRSQSMNSSSDALKKHLADLTSATTMNSTAFNATDSLKATKEIMSNQTISASTDMESQIDANVDNENIRSVYNCVIRTMNNLVSKKMQDVDFALRRESHIIPAPNADILCIMKWSNFLDAFCQGFAFIWQVKLKEGTYLVATIRNMMPMICEAMGVVNITALKPEKVPLMGRMLLSNIRNEHTTKLAVVMQGKPTYWIVKGFLKADPSMACNKPTPETHPSLTKKINVLCTSLVKQRQKQMSEKKNEQQVPKPNIITNIVQTIPIQNQFGSAPIPVALHQNILALQPPPPPPPYQNPINSTYVTPPPAYQVTPSFPTIPQQSLLIPPQASNSFVKVVTSAASAALPSNTMITDKVQSSNNLQSSRKRKSTGDIANINGMTTKMEAYTKMNTNIEFRKVTPNDIDEIHLPEIHQYNHKWLVLDLHNDFSHIFVPEFRDLVSLDRIQKVITFAKQKHKVVKLQFFQNAPFDAFVTPKSGRKLYFGPLNMDTKAPTLILLQSVDGQMMLRELYQIKHNIEKSSEEKTKAFWLLQMNGQTHFEIETSKLNELENNAQAEATVSANENVIQDDEDDCMIIDEVPAAATNTVSAVAVQHSQQIHDDGRYNFTIGSVNNNTNIAITSQSNSLPGPPPIQKLVNSRTIPAQKLPSSNVKISNINSVTQPITKMPLVATSQQQTPANLKPTTSTMEITSIVTPNANNAASSLIVVNKSNETIVSTVPSQDAIYTSTFATPPPPPSQSSISNPSLISPPPPPPAPSSTNKSKVFNQTTSLTSTTANTRELQMPPALKRRRVSVVCHDSYDRTSQNIAVNAVINKILPENIQDIQVNQSLENLKSVSTIGSTTITKISENINEKQPQQQFSKNDQNVNSAKPLVFDVSFVEGGEDEPAASIVIKPNHSPAKVTTQTTALIQTSSAPASSTITSNVNSSQAIQTPTFCIKSSTRVPYKYIKIPVSTPSSTNSQHVLTKIVSTSSNKSSATLNNTVTTSTSIISHPITSALPKKVLNTINPIKITNLTSLPLTKAPVKMITTAPNVVNTNVKILPKPVGQTSTTNFSIGARSITITPMTSTPACVANTSKMLTKVSMAYPAKTLPISSSITVKPVVSAAAVTTTTVSNQRLITSANTTNSTPSSGLAITSVKSFGVNNNSTVNIKSTSMSVCGPPAKVTKIIQSVVTPPAPPAATSLSSSSSQLNIKFNQSGDKNLSASSVTSSSSLQPQQKLNNEGVGTLPRHIQYGYIVSPVYTDFKFVAKRVMEEFYVKVPSIGILKLMGLPAVQNNLNKYVQKISEKNTLLGDWKFMAASKAVQLQNHQKSLLVRKGKSGNDLKSSTRVPITNSSKPDSNKLQKVVTSISEPILIDD
ncbi:over compensating males [Haematobia irritans]|uniref:over compensating males n=1 Tax=Haematobia irritans TaxID=7368 RepID=UPI003F501906